MFPFIQNRPYSGPVKAVILDWAGTAVDFGSMAPPAVLVEVFEQAGIGVTPSEAAAGPLSQFDADGGLMGAGLELRAVYTLNERWDIQGTAGWLRLLNDAADSPVTKAGSEDQFNVSVILTRNVSLDF